MLISTKAANKASLLSLRSWPFVLSTRLAQWKKQKDVNDADNV